MDKLIVKGARENNLKNIDIELPRDKLIVISGLSGSGKSSLAFDTIFAEGQRRYVESLSAYARQFLGQMKKPDVDYIEGLSPAISIEQKTTHRNPRSTVGTVTEIYDYYRLLFARVGTPHCPKCGREIREQGIDQILDTIMSWKTGTKLQVLAPVVRGKKGEHQKILEDAAKQGFVRARVDGEIRRSTRSLRSTSRRSIRSRSWSTGSSCPRTAGAAWPRPSRPPCRIADGIVIVTREDGGQAGRRVLQPARRLPRLQHQPAGAGAAAVLVQHARTAPAPPAPASASSWSSIRTWSYRTRRCRSTRAAAYPTIPTPPGTAPASRPWPSTTSSASTPRSSDLPAKVMKVILYGGDEAIKVRYDNAKGTGHFEYESVLSRHPRRAQAPLHGDAPATASRTGSRSS